MTEPRPLRPVEDRTTLHDPVVDECWWCGQRPRPADQLVPVQRHYMTQSIVLALRTPCCHVRTNTEPWGWVLDYLCDGWARAELVCRLYNADVGAPVEAHRERPHWCLIPVNRR